MKRKESHFEFIKKCHKKNVVNVFMGSMLYSGTYRALRSIGLQPYKVTNKETRKHLFEEYAKVGALVKDNENIYIYLLLPENVEEVSTIKYKYFICDLT